MFGGCSFTFGSRGVPLTRLDLRQSRGDRLIKKQLARAKVQVANDVHTPTLEVPEGTNTATVPIKIPQPRRVGDVQTLGVINLGGQILIWLLTWLAWDCKPAVKNGTNEGTEGTGR